MSDNPQLKQLRAQIDGLDDQIQDLINERAALVQKIGALKQNGASQSFYRPDREAQILRRILERNKGPMPDADVARLFREIISACLALEAPLQVAFLGPDGTFTQEAAWKHFGHAVKTLPLAGIDQVF